MAFALDNALYLPTYITEAEVTNLAVGDNRITDRVSRELKNRILRVQKIAADANANVTIKLRENTRSVEESNALNMDHTAEFDMQILSRFYFGLFNTTAAVITNFAYRYGFWILKPTISDKIFYEQKLTDEETGIADEFDLTRLVEQGSLPLPLDTMLKRTFKRTTRRTVSGHINLTTAGAIMGDEYSPVDSFLILESIALEKPPTGAYTTACAITVDEKSYHSIRAWAMSGALYDVPFWIPCEKSFELNLSTNTAIAGYDYRYRYSVVKRTEYLDMLFGFLTREDDEELWKRVMSGIGPE